MELSIEEKAILAHVVIDPDAWEAHALEHGGEPAVTAKIDRWSADYLAKKDLPDYMNRAERDAFELAQIEANKPIPTYAELRRAEYAPTGDQLDNITKALKYLSDNGIAIGTDGDKQVDDCFAVKLKYPKA